jgi:transcriptional regulator with GAF, ATPase, and Fis domain
MMELLPETRAALAELVSFEDPDVEELLHDLGEQARHIVPALVGLSLGLASEGLTLTMVASGTAPAALDSAQYLDGGPCVEVAEGRSESLEVRLDDPLDEERWGLYARLGAAVGVASSLSLPLDRRGHRVGGVNLYASTSDAFNGHHEELADLMGVTAAEAVSNADLSFSTRLEAAVAPARLRDQATVDTAVGLLAAVRHSDIDTAHRRLTEAAARAGLAEAVVARVVVLLHANSVE